MLHERLVCSVNDSRIQWRLLSKADLDFDKALKTALAMEMADKDAEDLLGGLGDKKTPVTEGAVLKACIGEPQTRGYQNCYRCGEASLCKHKETVCHRCGKKGHICIACRKQAESRSETRSPLQTHRNTMPVTMEGEDVYIMFPLRSLKYDPIYITIIVNGSWRWIQGQLSLSSAM